MPTKVEKDSVTGVETTGHEWDGIKELNNPLPKWWLYVLYVCIAFSFVYWILYPAIPGITGYTKGVIGGSAREKLVDQLAMAREWQGEYLTRIESMELADIGQDPEALNFALAGGRAAFADNCAPCHGLGGSGRPGGFPSLADDDWIWGGELEDIQATVLYGVRQDNDDSRASEMPAYGADELLAREEIEAVTDYVLSLSGSDHDAELAKQGETIYAENCAACHGEEGEGLTELGAPRLNDQIWLYGGERAEIIAQIYQPRYGVMPGWEGRLDDATIKMLAVYVYSLGGGQ